MNSNANQKEIETIHFAKQLLLDYYNELPDESNDSSIINGNIDNLSLNDIINKIKDAINNILTSYKSIEKQISSEYEPIIQKLEADIRIHYKIESELKLRNQFLEEKLKSFLLKEKQCQGSTKVNESQDNRNHRQKEDDLSDKDDDIKEIKEVLIVKAENSNLKARVSKYETIIQIGDQKEKEMNEEFNIERERLLKEISILEAKLSHQKQNKSVYSTSNYNINIGNIYDTNIISKNHPKFSEAKDVKKSQELSKSSRSPHVVSIKKWIGKIKPDLKQKSKETSEDIELNTLDGIITTPKERITKLKKSNHLKESLSNKNYFINTYNKMMNKLSPQKTPGVNLTTRKPLRVNNTSLSKPKTNEGNKATHTNGTLRVSSTSHTNSTNVNSKALHSSGNKKYKITNFMIYKSPEGKKHNKMSSSSREERRVANCSLKK